MQHTNILITHLLVPAFSRLCFWFQSSLNVPFEDKDYSKDEEYYCSDDESNTFTVVSFQRTYYYTACIEHAEASKKDSSYCTWSCYCNSFSHYFCYTSAFRSSSRWGSFYWRQCQAIWFCIYRYYYSVWEPWWDSPCSIGSGTSRANGGSAAFALASATRTTKDSAKNEDDDKNVPDDKKPSNDDSAQNDDKQNNSKRNNRKKSPLEEEEEIYWL